MMRRPRQPQGGSFHQSGPGSTCTVLRLRPPGFPFRCAFMLKGETDFHELYYSTDFGNRMLAAHL